MAPLLYVSRFEIATAALDDYARWYPRHAADLLGVGFLAVHGYRSADDPRHACNLYEIPDLTVFGDAYARARENDELAASLRPRLSNAVLAVYEQVAITGQNDAIGAPVLTGIAPASPAREALTRLAQHPGVVTVRMCRAIDAPVAPLSGEGFRAFVEWRTREDATAAGEADVLVRRTSFRHAD